MKKQGFLKIKNRIYQEVFHLEWVQIQLAYLRPYSQAFDTWVASNQENQSRLLRGQALIDAQTWAHGKSLSNLDYRFLAESEEFDRAEVQHLLETEYSKEAEARLLEQQKRLDQERKAAKIVMFLLLSMTTKLVISLCWGASLLQKIHRLEAKLECTQVSHLEKVTSLNIECDLP